MQIDYAKSITFAFNDEEWLSKIGRAALWAFLSMLMLIFPLYMFMLGYLLETTKNVINKKENPLPELNNITDLFNEGVRLFAVLIVYSSPLIIVYCLYFGFAFVPLMTLAAEDPESLAAFSAASSGFSLALQCVMYIYGLGMGLLLPAIVIRFIETDDVRETLKIGEVIKVVREHFVPCLMILIMYIAAVFIWYFASLLSIITICGIFVMYFVGPPWIMAVLGHLIGQFYNQLNDSPESPQDQGFAVE